MQGKPTNILLVEDDSGDAALIIRGLGANGLANGIRLVFDGEAALDYLFRRGEFTDAETSPVLT
jgi:hypothetical protein